MMLQPRLPLAAAFRFGFQVLICSDIVAIALEFRPDARRVTLNPFDLHGSQDLMKNRESGFTAISPDPPRMLVAEGCDGSTAILAHAVNILALHGIDAGDPHAQKELLNKPRNKFINASNDDIVTAMQMMKKERTEGNKTLVFKSIMHRDMNATVSPGLVQLGTLAVYSTRRNTLDRLVCMIRDCFVDTDASTTKYGYPVDENGQPDEMCLGSNQSNASSTYKAQIRTDLLAENLVRFQAKELESLEHLRKAGYNPLHVIYEDVMAFEKGGRGDVDVSTRAWSTILESWEVPVSTEKLRAYLASQAGTYQPVGQFKVIYNMNEVAEELIKIGRQDLIHDHRDGESEPTHSQDLAKPRQDDEADSEPPRMLVAEGCDGSTAVLNHAVLILALHGINAGDMFAHKELLYKPLNRFITANNTDIVTAMQQEKEARKMKKQTLVFKSILHRDFNATINPGLVKLGTLAVYITRRNTLDRMVCMIRDCFGQTEKFGYRVDESGDPTTVCFGRHHASKSSPNKAIVWTEGLGANLADFEKQEATSLNLLQKSGYANTKHVTFEDAVAFEKGGNENIKTSAKAWRTILEAWKVPVLTEKLWKYLENQGGTYTPPGQHKKIYNFGEVTGELAKLGRHDLVNEEDFYEWSLASPFSRLK